MHIYSYCHPYPFNIISKDLCCCQHHTLDHWNYGATCIHTNIKVLILQEGQNTIGFRYNGLSVVYLIFLLILPLCPRPNDITVQGCTGHLLRTISYTSFIFLMLQVSFQIAFYYLPPNDFVWEEVLSHFGIVRFSRLDAGNIIHLLAPDIGMFLFGLTVMLLCRKTVKLNNWESELPSGDHDQFSSDEEEDMKETESEAETEDTEDIDIGCLFEKDCLRCSHSGFLLKFTSFLTDLEILCEDTLRTAGKVFIMLLLGSTGIILPSACSAVYFFTFLGLCTWWSWNCPINPVLFNSLCVFLAIFSAGHIIVLYLYQLPYFQDLISSEIIYVRILGIVPFIKTNITAPWKLHIHPHLNWPVALNPFFLLSLYYLLVRILQQRALPAKGPKEEVIQFHSEDYVEIKMHSMLQVSMDANGKVVSLSSEIPQECFLLQNQNHSGCSMDGYINHGHRISLSGVLDHNFIKLSMSCFIKPPIVINIEHTIYSETSEEVNEKCNMEKKSSAFLALAQFIANQSYVIALITMMVWSITYNSWLTFVLLIWSCIIWMVHDRHLYALRSLPFLVTYGNVLVILNFIVGLNLSQEELFPGLTFWLLLKQYVMQIQKQKEEEFLKEVIVHQTEMDTSQNLFMEILGSIFKRILVKYWIYFCSIMFFIVSFNGKVVLYKILYVIFFLFCVALYQINYEGWRRILKGFWLISVSYSMIVLIALYAYQFEMVSAFFLKTLEISEESEAIPRAKNKVTARFMIVTARLPISQYWKNPEAPLLRYLYIEKLKDLGLELFSTKELFTKIILPCAFLLVCIVQLHYFHKDFLNITDLTNISVNPSSSSARYYMQTTVFNLHAIIEKILMDGCVKGNKWAEEVDNLAPCLLKIIAIAQDMQVFAWRFLELHILKIVSTYTIWITLQEVCLMNYVFLIVWTFAIPYSKFRPYASRICTFWSCVMVICKMLYQLKFIKPWNYSSNCTQDLHLNITYRSIYVDEFLEKSSLYVAPIDPALWIGGLMKCSDNIFLSLKNHLTILILMALEATVYRHQYFYWTQNQILPPVTGSLFNNIARENLDEGLLNCIKYCLNYSFYKFGLEICFVAAVNVIGQRMDLYALIHASWLTYLLSYRQRKAIAQVWPKYCFFLASIVAFQYLLCIGLPPALCQDDFLLLLFASFQWQVFEDEDQLVVRLQAGDNSEINQDLGPAGLSEFSWVGACAYLNKLQINYCWLIQTFAMYCTIPGYEVDPPNNEICELPKDEAGILWDAVCFTFLLIQRRAFMSHYYLYIVTDLKATDFLASSGSYCLFDTDSEDEEEHEHSEMRKKELFKKKTAWQLAYEAWMRNAKSALNMREQDEIRSERNKKEEERKNEQLPGIERESIVQRIINIIKLISILMNALMYGTIEALNSLVKDNLDIANALRMEKHILWQQMNKVRFLDFEVLRSNEIDKDVMGTEKIEGRNEKEALSQGFTLTTSCAEPAILSSCPSEIQESADSLFTRSPKANKPLGEISPMMTTSELLEQSDKFYQCLPCPLKLGVALYHVMVSTSEMLCYFVIIVNHMVSASILTLVLSILIFLWPMLSIPRPTKFFWMTAIIYTEIMIVIKCISQFGFFPWSSKLYCSISAEAPFALPNLIGIEKKDGYAQNDLVQLLALFLHRYILKCQGLWDSKILDPKQKDMAKKSKKKGCKGHLKEPQSSSERWHLSRNIFKRTNRGR
ncbi:Piezo-type mechanosensitive ion channel component 2, partial [Ophiophagus hannah]